MSDPIKFVSVIATPPGTVATIEGDREPTFVCLLALDSGGVVWARMGTRWVSLGGRPQPEQPKTE